MKNLLTTLIAFGILAFGSTANAGTITPTSTGVDDCNYGAGTTFNPTNCWNGSVTDENDAFDAAQVTGAVGYAGDLSLELLYKANADEGTTESGSYSEYYNTTWVPTFDEAGGGTIGYIGGVTAVELAAARALADAENATQADIDAFNALNAQVIDCGTCYLYVKDGNNDPNWYIFNISYWDGMSDLDLEGFWTGGVSEKGSISHVSIFGAEPLDKGLIPPVPVPAAVWLFGSGLIGLVAVSRRRKVTDNRV